MPEIYSHSRLSSFESCPRKFHYRYVQKLPVETESIEAFAGKRVHEVLERLYKAALQSRFPSLERVLRLFRELWTEHFKPETVRIARAENGARALPRERRALPHQLLPPLLSVRRRRDARASSSASASRSMRSAPTVCRA